MTRPVPFLRSALSAGLLAAAFGFAPGAMAQGKSESVRPEIGKPLQAAQGLVKQRNGRAALAEVAKAEAVPNRSAYENLLINQMKGAAAQLAGDSDTAIKSYEAVLSSGRITGRDATTMVQAIAVGHYQRKDYSSAAKWTQRYFKEGGNDPQMRTVLLQSYYLGNDCPSVNKMLGEGGENRRATEEELQILANCYLRGKDTGGYVATIEKLVQHYPKKEYWTDLLSRVQKKPGFSDRLGINVYRLKLATNNMTTSNDYMEAAQLALQAGVPSEGVGIIEQGYKAGLLGKGNEAERHGRLRDLANKQLEASKAKRAEDEKEALAAKDGNALVTVGLNYVYEGNAAKGLPLIEQGIKKGGLKRPEDAKLRLAEAQLHAGQKQKAANTFREVKGNDGAADVARLWVLNTRA
jgi:outer membrane protein assembly factor BamD (BamD/ComL family)